MKKFVRRLLEKFRLLVDLPMAAAVIPSALVLLTFRRLGAKRLPICREVLRTMGVFPIRDHYYEPLFKTKHLLEELCRERVLPGIQFAEEKQLELLRGLRFAAELEALKLGVPSRANGHFKMTNGTFGYGDADFLYQFLRASKPRRLVEIGGGASTVIAKLALEKNYSETGISCKHICIEPYENTWLEQLGVDVIRKKVEECQLEIFKELNEHDLLFIDSSHMIRPRGDVLFIYLSILPSLKKGVFVHIHDIFTPEDYPSRWIHEDVLFWNEQYLVEAILSMSDKVRIVASLNYLWRRHFDALKECCPYLSAEIEPGSLYLEIR